MPRYKNQRELDEMMEDELQAIDVEAQAPEETRTKKEVDWEKRYGDLRAHQSHEKSTYEARISQLEKQLEGMRNGTLKPPKSKGEIDEWKTQYPEFSEVLESWIDDVVKDKTKDFQRQSNEIKREKALLDLKRKHPDAENIFADNKFHEWLGEQSEAERNYIYKSFDVKNASFVLDKYKLENGGGKSSTRDEDDDFDPKSAARSVRNRTKADVDTNSGGYLYSESQIEEMSKKDPRWWDANEEKIFEAQRRGKVLMDITGGAR